jgi:hypothetical protein
MCAMDSGQITRLPAKERLEQTPKFDNRRLRDIAEVLGLSTNLMLST